MPIFEYRCPECGRVEERIELTPNPKPPTCCNLRRMQRVQFSKGTGPDGNAVFFRGTGWYETDYKEKK